VNRYTPCRIQQTGSPKDYCPPAPHYSPSELCIHASGALCGLAAPPALAPVCKTEWSGHPSGQRRARTVHSGVVKGGWLERARPLPDTEYPSATPSPLPTPRRASAYVLSAVAWRGCRRLRCCRKASGTSLGAAPSSSALVPAAAGQPSCSVVARGAAARCSSPSRPHRRCPLPRSHFHPRESPSLARRATPSPDGFWVVSPLPPAATSA